ncbi:MAG: type I-U CRISPR-associated protein Cas7 [Thermomicrobium sp.]|uniref:type I-G CRISPR-associated RAMP protein Csb1/Cas7g n=1 Tax=Thermomicrobium sp. TaxID=1969469 RepID=UPI001B2A96AB|nr:type I-U CRISPR-associated RAMP protein Csb1/Cas7u [Thermomicrobium sp.]MBO9360087.1 type I-U CRISPR-associated protein Cas7 [Thermomicrobium sp.]
MTSQAAENTNPLSDETRKLIDGWLEPDGPVALHLRQKLLPVEADENGVIFPPTYADIGYNIDTLADGTLVATIDSVGSQANRLEPIFKSTGKDQNGNELNPLASLVPQIEIVLYKAGGKVEKRSLLDLAHRAADAVVLASPTLAPEIAKAFEALRNTGNAAPLAAIAPTSLVFGVWDSRGGTGEKRPRLVRSIIRAWDVEVLHSAAQFNSVWKALSEEQKNDLVAEEKKKGKLKLSDVGLKDAPAIFRKTDKIPQFVGDAPNPAARILGGVRVKGSIERDVTINLVALRGIRGKDDSETNEVQKYLLGLALLAATADIELFLREGCLLRYANDDNWKQVPRRGDPTDIKLPSQDQLFAYAVAAAAPFRAKWPKDQGGKDLPLEHEFSLAEAKKLLAKKDDNPSAAEES